MVNLVQRQHEHTDIVLLSVNFFDKLNKFLYCIFLLKSYVTIACSSSEVTETSQIFNYRLRGRIHHDRDILVSLLDSLSEITAKSVLSKAGTELSQVF